MGKGENNPKHVAASIKDPDFFPCSLFIFCCLFLRDRFMNKSITGQKLNYSYTCLIVRMHKHSVYWK